MLQEHKSLRRGGGQTRALMDFALTADQREIQALARDLAQAEIEPNAAAGDREHASRRALREAGRAGPDGRLRSGRARRRRADFLSYILVLEELSRADAGVGVTVAVHTSACTLPILAFGTEEQRERFVPPSRAATIGAFALTEPEAGSTQARSGRAPTRTATAGRSRARSSGSRTGATPAPSSLSPAASPTSRAHAASRPSSSTPSTCA